MYPTDLSNPEPLMQPVQWQGQTYYTSQYFHRQYVADSQYGGKYERHNNFLRAVRDIEAYSIYLERGDIVELTWSALKDSNDVGTPIWSSLKRLFEVTSWNPITLLNGTAQLALSHHLDDEMNKQLSVAVNVGAAQQQRRLRKPSSIETAKRDLKALLGIAKLLKVPAHIAQQEAVKMVAQSTGVNLRPLLSVAPAQNNIAPEEVMLEPTELAQALRLGSAIVINKALERIGWQVKCDGSWEPTPAGAPHSAKHSWSVQQSTKSGYNLKWNLQAVAAELASWDIKVPSDV